MADSDAQNDDLKAKMREALERKNSREKGVHQDGPVREKAERSIHKTVEYSWRV